MRRARPLRFHHRPTWLLPAAALLAAAPCRAEQAGPAEAQQVVVTASRHALLAIEAPASLSVVDRRAIEDRGADNVLEAVRNEPGVTLQGRAVGGRKALALRGLDARHTLLLVDGQRTVASAGVVGSSDFEYDGLSTADIERVEVVRGPLSVLYGSEAMGGVVNVITRGAGPALALRAMAEGTFAEGDRGGSGWRAAAGGSGPIGGGVSFTAGLSASRAEPVASLADPRLSELEGRDKHEAWLRLDGRFGAHQLRAERRDGTEHREAAARERSGQRRYHLSFNDVQRDLTSLAWDADWAAPGAEPLATQLRAYRVGMDIANRRTEGVALNPHQRLTDEVIDGQAQASRGAHAGTAGFEAHDERLEDPGLPGGQATARHRALFVQDEWQALRGMTLTFGVRHDEHSQFGAKLSPRAYAVWRAAPGWVIKGGVSDGFMAPNLKQTVPGSRLEGPNTVHGNPALKPETSRGAEIGIGHERRGLQLQATVFRQAVHELIDLRLLAAGSVPGTGTYVYENLSRARLQGLESALTLAATPVMDIGLSYNYLDARDGNGKALDKRPRHTGGVRLELHQGAWRAGALAQRTGSQLLAGATAAAGLQRVPGYTLLDLHAAWVPAGPLELQLGLRNALDVRLAQRSPLFTQAEAPRTWRIALRGHW